MSKLGLVLYFELIKGSLATLSYEFVVVGSLGRLIESLCKPLCYFLSIRKSCTESLDSRFEIRYFLLELI